MRRKGAAFGAVGLMFTLNCLGYPGLARSQPTFNENRARELVADQIVAQAGLSLKRPELISLDVGLSIIHTLAPNGVLVRAEPTMMSHGHPYILAAIGDSVFGLGGFAAPQLRELALATRERIRDSTSAVKRAMLLATAADPNGAARLVPTNDTSVTGRQIIDLWKRQRNDGPSDAVISLPGGATLVRITVLSRNTWSGEGELWAPLAYVFVFGPTGELRAWSRWSGEYFSSRARPPQ
jgi:hypothetical protein